MWERGGGYERVEVRRGEVRKWTDVPLHSRSSADRTARYFQRGEASSPVGHPAVLRIASEISLICPPRKDISGVGGMVV
jgi:hypothetical protein